MLYIMAGKKTTQFFQDLGEQEAVSSGIYHWRRSEFFWHSKSGMPP